MTGVVGKDRLEQVPCIFAPWRSCPPECANHKESVRRASEVLADHPRVTGSGMIESMGEMIALGDRVRVLGKAIEKSPLISIGCIRLRELEWRTR